MVLHVKRCYNFLEGGIQISNQSYPFSSFERENLDFILELALSLGKSVSGSLLLKGERGLALVAGKNLHPSHFGERAQNLKNISEMVFESGQPLFIDSENPSLVLPRRQRADRYSLSFPVRDGGGRVIGVLNLNRADEPFTQGDIGVVEKLASAIALLIEENTLRRNRERLLVVFSEIINLFEGKECFSGEKIVFERVFAAVAMLLEIERGAIFKLAPQRPYLVFRANWPRQFNFRRLGLNPKALLSEERPRVVDIVLGKQTGKLLLLPIYGDLGWHFLSVFVVEREPELLEYLVLSMIARLGKSCLDNILLFRRNERLIQDREKNQLARELHDGLAQILASSQLYLHFLKNDNSQKDPYLWQEVLEKLDYLIRMGIEESRFILSELAGKPISALRLKNDLEGIISTFSLPGLFIHREITINVRSVSFRIFRVITSIVREALSNVAKHSEAQNVWISLRDDEQFFYLSVKDDGKGLTEDASLQREEAGHFGIYSMRSRVKLVRGHIRLSSSPGKGVTIEAKIPVQ